MFSGEAALGSYQFNFVKLGKLTSLVFLTALMIVFLVRHYIFTLTVLRRTRKTDVKVQLVKSVYEPTVSILIPARNEENVVGRLLQRMTELTYPQENRGGVRVKG